MKTQVILSAMLLCTGCTISSSKEIQAAEKLLEQFQCNNIETAELTHSAINNYNEHALTVSKEKAFTYLENYKSGHSSYDLPLNDVIQQQYVIYQIACQSLGGVQLNKNN